MMGGAFVLDDADQRQTTIAAMIGLGAKQQQSQAQIRDVAENSVEGW